MPSPARCAACRNDGDGLANLVSETHHRTLAVVLLDLSDRELDGLLAVRGLLRHGMSPFSVSVRPVFGRLPATLERDSDKTARSAGRTEVQINEHVFDDK